MFEIPEDGLIVKGATSSMQNVNEKYNELFRYPGKISNDNL